MSDQPRIDPHSNGGRWIPGDLDQSESDRHITVKARLQGAIERDVSAYARDVAATARDEAAAARDVVTAQLDDGHDPDRDGRPMTGAEIIIRAAEQRRRAGMQRARAAEQRRLAGEDRLAAARDREQGAQDRLQARADREALARQLAIAETDAVTGARTRAAGLVELDRELARCRRTASAMVVAYVDVVGLKAINDSAGHQAGDDLLKRAVAAIKAHLRAYDIVIRLGGDEFLCAMPNMSAAGARERFAEIAAALAGASEPTAIRTGFAELGPDESAGQLIARADRELLAARD
jgi:diguanylate cyclase (GGDEF)-like protein